jgi:hypothetical protein
MEIVSGLNEGARIVTHPTDTLVEGMMVKVIDASATKAGAKQLAQR